MSADDIFTKENLFFYLGELAKEYRRLNGRKVKAEIILVGGAAVLSSYGFRDQTMDVDALIYASESMKEAINHVGDMYHLPNGWLNSDFRKSASYTDKLYACSEYVCTKANILDIRTVRGEYLIAMKLASGRIYKKDLSDIVGILSEEKKAGKTIDFPMIDKAVKELYGSWEKVNDYSRRVLEAALTRPDLEKQFELQRAEEQRSRETLREIIQTKHSALKTADVNELIAEARKMKKERGEDTP